MSLTSLCSSLQEADIEANIHRRLRCQILLLLNAMTECSQDPTIPHLIISKVEVQSLISITVMNVEMAIELGVPVGAKHTEEERVLEVADVDSAITACMNEARRHSVHFSSESHASPCIPLYPPVSPCIPVHICVSESVWLCHHCHASHPSQTRCC